MMGATKFNYVGSTIEINLLALIISIFKSYPVLNHDSEAVCHQSIYSRSTVMIFSIELQCVQHTAARVNPYNGNLRIKLMQCTVYKQL